MRRRLTLSTIVTRAAFTALFLHSSGGDRHLAEEITQELFLLLIRRPGKFDSRRGSLSAYLLGAARNLLRQHWKRNRIQVEIPDDDAAGSLLSDDDVFGDLTSREALQALHLAILALPLHYREVVVLCHLEGMEYAEAGQVLGCPAGTVCSRLSRARALLVEKLKGHGSCLSTTRMSAI